MNFIIKEMETDAEIRGKGYVHWKSWQETYPGLVDRQYLESLTLQKCTDIAFQWPDRILIAKETTASTLCETDLTLNTNVAGFAGYGAYRDDTLADTGEIYAIYVLQKYQQQKIGYALMNAAIEKLKDYSAVALWVLKGNEKAIRFYERYGFRFDGTEQEISLGKPNTELRMLLKR